MSKDILKSIGELEGIDVDETVLDVCVDDELGEAQDLAAQVEGVSREAGLFALFGRERPERKISQRSKQMRGRVLLDRLQVHVVVEVQVVQVLQRPSA